MVLFISWFLLKKFDVMRQQKVYNFIQRDGWGKIMGSIWSDSQIVE